MPGDSTLLLFVLLVLAAAAGAWTARRFTLKPDKATSKRPAVSPDYFKGVTYLLNEQPDKAIEVFVRMAEVDNETVETHFALGSLFRRRGEVDRAIRIHQNIIARPNLAKKQRDQALFALAEDYQKAGLFDRAEKLFQQLSAVPGQRKAAMRSLVRIYEQQKDWTQAIEVRNKLGVPAPEDDDGGMAHAYCELAQQAINEGDYDAARVHLRKSRTSGSQLVRSAFMRAAVAEEQKDYKASIKLCKWIVEHDESFIIEVLPLLLRCLRASGGDDSTNKVLQSLLNKKPKLREAMAMAALSHNEWMNPVLQRAVRDFLRSDTFASKLRDAVMSEATEESLTDQQLGTLAEVLSELIRSRAKYECRACGYAGNMLYWQCPGCKDWDSTRPIMRLVDFSARRVV
ncbi:MAG: lipopolysaccharide assembly protein LapB [Gammaproteobacteria bacterium]